MKKIRSLSDLTSEFMALAKNFEDLKSQVSELKNRIPVLPSKSGHSAAFGNKSNIIPFPLTAGNLINYRSLNSFASIRQKSLYSHIDQILNNAPIIAHPGKPLPAGIFDYRPGREYPAFDFVEKSHRRF